MKVGKRETGGARSSRFSGCGDGHVPNTHRAQRIKARDGDINAGQTVRVNRPGFRLITPYRNCRNNPTSLVGGFAKYVTSLLLRAPYFVRRSFDLGIDFTSDEDCDAGEIEPQ